MVLGRAVEEQLLANAVLCCTVERIGPHQPIRRHQRHHGRVFDGFRGPIRCWLGELKKIEDLRASEERNVRTCFQV